MLCNFALHQFDVGESVSQCEFFVCRAATWQTVQLSRKVCTLQAIKKGRNASRLFRMGRTKIVKL